MSGALTYVHDSGGGARRAGVRSPREFLRCGWQSAAIAYHDLWGELTRQSVETMLDALAVTAGCALLDVGCGPGYVATAAARRGAYAMGVDFSDAMIRVATRLHPGVEFRRSDAENLSFAAHTFSAVAMNFTVQHFTHPERALHEAHRVLRPGGRIAFSIFARPELARAASVVYAAIEAHGTFDAPLPPAPPLWRLDCADAACGVLRAAGFDETLAAPVAMTWRLDSTDDFWRAFYDGSVRTKALLRAQSTPALAAIRRAIDASLRAYERAGRIEIPMQALVISAVKRGAAQ